MLNFKGEVPLEHVRDREWLVTNGIGGYASSTLSGMNTRRYHGLLVAAQNPPVDRRLLVSKVDETVLQGENEIHICTNQFPGKIFPEGYQFLKGFDRDPLPKTTFKGPGFHLDKTVWMVYGSNTTLVEYRNSSNRALTLRLRPLLVDRDFHGIFKEDPYFDFYCLQKDNHLKIHSHYGANPLFIQYTQGEFTEERNWFNNTEYLIDQERGQEFREDVYSVGKLECEIGPKESVFVKLTTEEKMLLKDEKRLKADELKRLKQLTANEQDAFMKDLLKAADQFIVKRNSTDSYTVLAGYPWFSDWGRDALISLPGLAILTGRQEIARSVITNFMKRLDQGMLPNRFADYDGDSPEYNTIDATLWLFIAIYEYDRQFEDTRFLRGVIKPLERIIKWHFDGTRYNIHVDENGFLGGGDHGTQLTWMDARVNDYAVTPRWGAPVEINALWYNALKIYQYICDRLGALPKKEYVQAAKKLKQNFKKAFWNDEGYLNDRLMGNGDVDDGVRPNQIYAISLPFSLLNDADSQKVFKFVSKHLCTKYGLRTLDPHHDDFRKEYQGNQWLRDTAYHQGTVWPFLFGDYLHAQLKTHHFSEDAKKKVRAKLSCLKDHFYKDNCVHGISEIFDGGEPRYGKGTMHQAWSVAGLIKILYLLKDDQLPGEEKKALSSATA